MPTDTQKLVNALWTPAAAHPAVLPPALEAVARAYIDIDGDGTGFDLSTLPEGRAADKCRDAAAYVLARRWLAKAKELAQAAGMQCGVSFSRPS